MKKFEPHYRLVRYGAGTKIEKASRQQRMYTSSTLYPGRRWGLGFWLDLALNLDDVLTSGCVQASNARTEPRL